LPSNYLSWLNTSNMAGTAYPSSSPPDFWWDPCCSSFKFFGVVILCVLKFWVPCCDVRSDFHIGTMFGSCLPPVVCGRAHVLIYVICVCLRIVFVQHILCRIFVLFCFSSSCIPYVASFSELSISDCPLGIL